MLEDSCGSDGFGRGGRPLTHGSGECVPDDSGREGPGVLVLSFVFGCLLGLGVLVVMLLFNLGGF